MMDMLGAAHKEARAERRSQADSAYARTLHQKEQLEERRQEELLRAQEQYAQKVQLEEEDGALAEQLRQQFQREEERRRGAERASERASEQAAAEMQRGLEEEAAAHAQAMRRLAEKDAKVARKAHQQEQTEAARVERQARKLAEAEKRDEARALKASEALARKLQQEEARAAAHEQKARRRQSSKDEKLARSVATADARSMKRVAAEQRKKAEAEKREQARHFRIAEKDAAVAAKLQAAEKAQFLKDAEERREQHEKDVVLARRMQREELGDAADQSARVQDSWSNPQVEVEETKSGCVITVQLPNVRRMEVDLDEEENAIFVNAIPKSSEKVARKVLESKMQQSGGGAETDESCRRVESDAAHDELKRIIKHSFVGELRPVSFEINLADIVEGFVCAEDIKSEYRAKEGILRLELEGVVAVSEKKQQKFRRGLLERLGGLFKRGRRGSSGKENKK
jgi:hypothetical protein